MKIIHLKKKKIISQNLCLKWLTVQAQSQLQFKNKTKERRNTSSLATIVAPTPLVT